MSTARSTEREVSESSKLENVLTSILYTNERARSSRCI